MSETKSLLDSLATLIGVIVALFIWGGVFYGFWQLALIEWLALDVPPLRYWTAVLVVAVFNYITNHLFRR